MRKISFILALIFAFNMVAFAKMTTALATEAVIFNEGTQILGYCNYDGKNDGIVINGNGMSYEKTDEEHGKSMFLPYNKGYQYLGYWSKKALEGRYGIGFSVYAEEMTYPLALTVKGKGSSGVVESAATYNTLRFTNTKRLFLHYTDANDSSRYLWDFESRKWYDVELWVDTVNQELSYFINGENIENIPWFDKLEEFHGFSLINAAGNNASSGIYIDNVWFVKDGENNVNRGVSPVYVNIEPTEKVIGNNYLKDKIPEFKVMLTNRLNTEKAYGVRCFVRDKDGNEVWQSEEEAVSLAALGNTERIIKAKPNRYGIMEFVVRITYGDKSYDIPLPFTYVNRSSDMPKNRKIGFTSHIERNRGTFDDVYELANTLGYGLVRTEYRWSGIERSKGQYTFNSKNIDYADKYDMDVLIIMFGSNPNVYIDDLCGGAPHNDEMEAAFKKAISEWIKLANGRIKYVENWNEYKSNSMRPLIPQQYYIDVGVRMHRAIYEGIKAVDPNVRVYAFDEDSWALFQTTAIDEMLQKFDGKDYWDGVTLHLYPQDKGKPESRFTDGFVNGVKDLLVKYGNKETAFACSEEGWSVFFGTGITRERVAAYTVRARAYNLAKFKLDFDIDYNLYDYNYFEAGVEGGFGAAEGHSEAAEKVPYLGKEKFCALAYWNALTADYQSMDMIEGVDEDNEFAYHIKDRNGRDILMTGLTGEGNKTVTYDLGCDRVTMTDIYGNEQTLYGIDGKFTVTLKTDEVTYLIGSFNEPKLTETAINLVKSMLYTTVNDEYVFDMTFPQDFMGEIIYENSNNVVKEVEFGKIANGKSTVKILTNPTMTETNDIKIKVVSGNKIYYDGSITVEYKASGSISNARIYSEKGSFSLWDIYFDLKNNSSSNNLNGRVTEPLTGRSVKLPDIAPGETRTVVFPHHVIKSIRELDEYSLSIEYDNGEKAEVKNDKEHILAKYTDKAPVIDGDLEKDIYNDDMTTLRLNSKDRIRSIVDWGGEDDLSAKAYLKYDMDNLYFAVDVTDNVHKNENTGLDSWRGDSIQFGITFDKDYDTGTSFMIGLSDTGEKSFWMNTQEGNFGGFNGELAKNEYKDGESAVKRVGDHTYYEMKMPWDKIKSGGGNISQGQEMRFSVLVNDNDGTGRRGWICYGEGIGDGSNATAKFDKLILLKK